MHDVIQRIVFIENLFSNDHITTLKDENFEFYLSI